MSKKAWIVSFSVILIIFLSSQVRVLDAKTKDKLVSEIPVLWNLASEIMEGKKRLIIRHSTAYRSYTSVSDFQKQALELGSALGMPKGEFEQHEEHPIYRTVLQENADVKISAILMGTDSQISKFEITRESNEEDPLISAVKWQKNVDRILLSYKSTPKWNIIVQGIEFKYNPKQDTRILMRNISNLMDARVIEQYKDSGTISTTFNSPKLRSFVYSGSNRVNLQVALHEITGTNDRRITIGTPLITTEY